MEIIEQLVSDVANFASLCNRLESQQFIAIDTEFTRTRTFYPRLEVLQLATDELAFCVDGSLCQADSKFGQFIHSQSSTLVFHSATQDLEVLALNQLIPERIVDTQVAAALCGYEKLSYQSIVEQCLGVTLSKQLTRSNWAQRPLSSKQLQYALDDVRFLLPVYFKLVSQLDRLNRLSWFAEECQDLLHKSQSTPSIEDSWKEFDGGAELPVADQYIAKSLCIWRERRAQRRNCPRQWILTDRQIVDLVTTKPKSQRKILQQIKLKANHPPAWISRIHSLLHSSVQRYSEPVWESKRLRKNQQARVALILEMIDKVATQNEIDPRLICTRKEAQEIVLGSNNVRLYKGWRRDLLGSTVDELFNS